MQVSVENTGGLERKLTIQVPGDEIQQKVIGKLKELSKQVRIKGFRPGRVPPIARGPGRHARSGAPPPFGPTSSELGRYSSRSSTQIVPMRSAPSPGPAWPRYTA